MIQASRLGELWIPETQVPRVLWVPEQAESTLGKEAIDYAYAAGLILDPWQKAALYHSLALDTTPIPLRPYRKWAAFEVGMLVARQNGKGSVLEARELIGAGLLAERMLHTAHEFKTAADHYLRMKAYYENYDWLRKQVYKFNDSHGEEEIVFKKRNPVTGERARLRFIARSKNSGRGFRLINLVVCDEAQELSSLAMAALTPTVSVAPTKQIWYTGTVPQPENNPEVFTAVRDRGRKGGDSSLVWIEHSAAEDDCKVNRESLQRANPALDMPRGIPEAGITEEFCWNEQRSMMSDPQRWMRERLCIWPSGTQRWLIIPHDRWNDHEDGDDKVDFSRGLALAVEVSPDHSTASIGLASFSVNEPDAYHLELIDRREGTGWVVDRLKELKTKLHPRAIVVDPGSPAGMLVPSLVAKRINFITVSLRDIAGACGMYVDLSKERRLVHIGQTELTDAMGAVTTRPVGDAGYAWDRKGTEDISPLMAVTLALHGFVLKAKGPTPEIF